MEQTQNQQVIVACAFLHHNGKLFAPKRAEGKKSYPNQFELPGGHIEYGEDIKEGLRREILEEFHSDSVIGDAFYAFTHINRKQQHTVEVIFFAQFTENPINIQLNPYDHSEYRWMTQAEALETFPEGPEKVALIRGFELLKINKGL